MIAMPSLVVSLLLRSNTIIKLQIKRLMFFIVAKPAQSLNRIRGCG